MYECFRRRLEKWLRLPPEPLDPMGGENTLQIFRAAPKYYQYRLLWWKVGLGVKGVIGLAALLGLTVGLGAAAGPLAAIGGLFLAALVIGFLAFTSLVSYVTIRLDYEYRWYKTTDRSLPRTGDQAGDLPRDATERAAGSGSHSAAVDGLGGANAGAGIFSRSGGCYPVGRRENPL